MIYKAKNKNKRGMGGRNRGFGAAAGRGCKTLSACSDRNLMNIICMAIAIAFRSNSFTLYRGVGTLADQGGAAWSCEVGVLSAKKI